MTVQSVCASTARSVLRLRMGQTAWECACNGELMDGIVLLFLMNSEWGENHLSLLLFSQLGSQDPSPPTLQNIKCLGFSPLVGWPPYSPAADCAPRTGLYDRILSPC